MFLKMRTYILAVVLAGSIVILSGLSHAQSTITSSRGLEQALASNDSFQIYNSNSGHGFGLSGGFFSGRASGIESPNNENVGSSNSDNYGFDRSTELAHDQRVYALLIDGSYDFNYDFGSGLPIHPYVNGGMGMAMADPTTGASTVLMQGGDTVPLFRLGGGVTYRLGEEWNLSLDYKTGFTGSGGDQVFTGRSQQSVDLQVLNMGMHYKF